VLTFNPAPNFEAPADAGANNVYDVTVQVSDGNGGTDTQALTITVTDANDAPFVTGDAYTVVEDTSLSVAAAGALANDGDEDGNPITAALVSGPANGAVAFNADGSFVYTPNANFAGVDSFTYHVSDGALVSADATVTITVTPVNDAPMAADGSVATAPGVAYTFSLADFNYTDVDGDPLDHVQITVLPTVGTLTLGGTAVALNQVVDAADIAAGNLQFVAPTGTMAADSFGFLVHDGTLYAAAGHTMTIGVIVPPPPPPPSAPPPTVTPPVTPPATTPAATPPPSSPDPDAGAATPAPAGAHGGGSGACGPTLSGSGSFASS
jgi:VCBS repeat-containing protein